MLSGDQIVIILYAH